MSIRKKLLLSNIAMIVIPVIVFVLTAMLIVRVFYIDRAGEHGGFPAETFAKSNELFAGLTLLADYDPKMAADESFLRQTEERLQEIDAALAIMQHGRLIYSSPELGSELAPESIEQGFRNEVTINGNHYALRRYDFQTGTLYFFENTDRFKQFFRSFFPMLFLALLLVIALTNGVLTYFVSRSILKPLQELKLGIERIKEGNLEQPLKLGRRDEIGQLEHAFEEMRQRLRQSILMQLQYEENRKELLANMSHDLKTPITAITNCVDGLRDGIADTPEKRLKYLDMIHKKVSEMDSQIDELFLFSKLDLKKLPFHYENIDIDAYLSDCADEFRLDPQTKGIHIQYENHAASPVYVIADREKLRRVIANIVHNSMKYLDKTESEIRFHLLEGDTPDEVTIKISDNGRGIDREALPHIFDRFYRADPSRSSDTGGSGLGLAIVKQIIEEHGGRTWAQSTAGVGTDILFTLKKSEGR